MISKTIGFRGTLFSDTQMVNHHEPPKKTWPLRDFHGPHMARLEKRQGGLPLAAGSHSAQRAAVEDHVSSGVLESWEPVG